jgi:hypothetical protein
MNQLLNNTILFFLSVNQLFSEPPLFYTLCRDFAPGIAARIRISTEGWEIGGNENSCMGLVCSRSILQQSLLGQEF